LNASLAQKLQAILYPPVAQVALGYRLNAFERPPEGFGFLVPKREGRSILGALFSSSFLPGRASDGFALLTTFVGGMRAPSLALLEANGLVDLVHKEVSDILRIKEEPTFAHVVKIERAIPQYTLGHGEMIKAIEALEHSLPGLHFLANYRGGIALGDCLANAADLSAKILRQISSRPV
jgi:oxygen-dependent protoporphyrinogen oxidase